MDNIKEQSLNPKSKFSTIGTLNYDGKDLDKYVWEQFKENGKKWYN